MDSACAKIDKAPLPDFWASFLASRASISTYQAMMKDELLTGQYYDMKITCEGFTFKVHRVIVCCQSRFFAAALRNDFKEAITQTIELPDDDLETVERVISYLYIQDYMSTGHIVPLSCTSDLQTGSVDPEETSNSPESDSHGHWTADPTAAEAYNNFRVYLAADKYGITSLKDLAAKRFALCARAHCETEAFLGLLPVVVSLLPPHDPKIQEIIADVISDHSSHFKSQEQIHEILKFGNIGQLVVLNLWRKGIDLRSKEEKDKGGYIARLGQKLDGRSSCRQCSKEFNVSLQGDEYERGIYRCSACRTRHSFF
ncbi:hypothetical protein BO70DRAFT_362307 [Aspergillus heteromorphus CBS 117.55]|uniref:BTB domain-containing protein n=1 Tax=Aspergillus heteromorphus CBS 117.55 TaxID=1448321 RepID=A0A317W833_9EURO|nr:uncharacterized protein BO70DRAFT_362307 [Aspergillus heteromorphus CBS 117.55]PWY81871.1 hypothetical protein BO70DRAFT_362307 [Aspergillus heteromorphus CBS 117.55]